MRTGRHQHPVLVALGLAFGAVDDHHRRPFRRRGRDRAPFQADREGGAASTAEAAAHQRFDERAPAD